MRILILSRNPELYSTSSLVTAAKSKGHFVRVVDHMHCDLIIENGLNEIVYEGYTLDGFDAAIPRIGHTATRYGSAVVRQLEASGVFTTLKSEALLKARDKLSSLQWLAKHGIDIPKTIFGHSAYTSASLAHELEQFPKIIKLLSGTHGLGVLKAENIGNLETTLEAFYNLKQKVIIQEFIRESAGQDVRAFVVDGQIVASMLRKAPPGEFRSNLHRGGSARKIELSPEEENIAIQAVKIMGLKVAGVDMLRSERGPLVLEVNASPGLEGIETTTRVNVSKKIIEFIERKVTGKKAKRKWMKHL